MQIKTVPVLSKPTAWITRSVLAAIGLLPLLLSQPGLAQSEYQPNYSNQNSQPLQEFKPQELNRDPFSNSSGGQSSGVFDIIHRANFGNIRPMNEYKVEQQENLTNAAAEFRAKQIELLRSQQNPQQNQATPTTPATTPTSTTP